MKIPFFKRKKDKQDETERAIAGCREAAERNPQDPRLRIKLAELLLSSGRKEEAVAAYCEAARAYEATGKNRIVTAIYQHVLSIDPGRIEIYRLLADAFMKEYLIGDAVETMVRLATYYYDHDRHYEAAQTIKEITSFDPDNRFYKSKVEKFLKEHNLSPEVLEKIGPKDKWTLVQPAGTVSSENAPRGGFVDLRSLLDEESIDIVISEEQIFPETGQDVAAGSTPEDVLRQIKSLVGSDADQDTPEFHYNLGLAFMNQGHYEAACEEFSQATAGGQHGADAYRCLIICYRKLGRYDDAARAADAGLKLKGLGDSDRLEMLYEQALVCKERGERKQALKIFKKIYEQDRNFRSVAREINELS